MIVVPLNDELGMMRREESDLNRKACERQKSGRDTTVTVCGAEAE